jgi:hypothetical protein
MASVELESDSLLPDVIPRASARVVGLLEEVILWGYFVDCSGTRAILCQIHGHHDRKMYLQ